MASRAAGETPRRGGFITTASKVSPASAIAAAASATSPVRTSRRMPCASAAVRALLVAGAKDSTIVTW